MTGIKILVHRNRWRSCVGRAIMSFAQLGPTSPLTIVKLLCHLMPYFKIRNKNISSHPSIKSLARIEALQ